MRHRLLSLSLLLFAVRCFGSVAITTSSVPNGIVGTAYSAVIKATGGCTPYVWSIASGSLPDGITATPSNTTTSLNLTGTPKKAATYSFTEQVTGCGGRTAKVTYKIVTQATANHVVDMSWTASTSTGVVGYNLYRAPDGVSWKKVTSLIPSTTYTDSTVANSSTYYYAATAVDVYGDESKKTPPVKAVIP